MHDYTYTKKRREGETLTEGTPRRVQACAQNRQNKTHQQQLERTKLWLILKHRTESLKKGKMKPICSTKNQTLLRSNCTSSGKAMHTMQEH